jgi:UDPglucose--hexose-1-phosphate uridylyltransferase
LSSPRDRYAEPHRRFNPLSGDWVLVSPHRAERPWQGQIEATVTPHGLAYDPNCYLCPGNERAGGTRNPNYTSTFVFTNDFSALTPDVQPGMHDESGKGLLISESEAGVCKVVCFSPRHDLTLARMTVAEIATVVNVWAREYAEIGSLPYVNYVQIFENRGEMMGCSNPHPHGQIWASQTIPNESKKEQLQQWAYAEKHAVCLLCEYLQMEQREQTRVILENDHFVSLVPFWAVWPFEVMVLSKQHLRDVLGLDLAARASLAEMLKSLTTCYDNLFETLFPYSMGFHQAPTDGDAHAEWHLHAHYYPPLLRSATVRKFLVGYELLAGPQRDITPEAAAAALRERVGAHWADCG